MQAPKYDMYIYTYKYMYICTYAYTYTYTYQGCTRTGTERLRVRKFGTDRPSEERNVEPSEPERTGLDRLRLGTEQTSFTRSGG